MTNARQPVSMRWSLLRSFLLLVLISSLLLFAMMQYRAGQTEQTLSLDMTQRGLEIARRQLDRFLEPARANARISATWGRDGILDIAPLVDIPMGGRGDTTQFDALARINRLFMPLLRSSKALSSVSIANAVGHGWGLLRFDDGRVQCWLVSRQSWDDQVILFDVDFDGTPAGGTWETIDVDLRERPWYRDAVGIAPGKLSWTEPYTYLKLDQPGIAASSGWERDGVEYVVSWGVVLTTLSDFTRDEALRVSDRSLTVVMDNKRRVLGVPDVERYRDPEILRADLLKSIRELDIPVIQDAVRAVIAYERETGIAPETVAYSSGDESWWGAVVPYPLPGSDGLRVAIVIPSSDLVGEITRLRLGLLISTVVALVAALVFALFLTRSYSRPLEALAAQSRRIRALDFSTGDPIAANVREVRELAETQAQSLAAVESFSRYVPVEVVRELVAEGDVARIGGQSRDMTLLFSDIADFTRISEGLEPQALADHMASYFDELIGIIQSNGGTVDKLVGDAIVAFWGAPRPDTDHAAGAVAAALACRSRLADLNAVWRQEGLPPLATRFGLATGSVIVGNFGAPERLAYTVLGDRVNLASRLEGLNKTYGTEILAAGETVAACGDTFAWRRLDRVAVKGHTQPTWVHELIGTTDAVDAATLARARAYEAAWESYAERGFGDAIAHLDALLAEAADTASQRLRARCAALATRPPGAEWDAVYRPETK
jgi:adenylate cyclase